MSLGPAQPQPKLHSSFCSSICAARHPVCFGTALWRSDPRLVSSNPYPPRSADLYLPVAGYFWGCFSNTGNSWIRRVEFFEFRNHWGKPVLHIIRERKQAADCAAFITALVAHIELAQSDLPPEERTKLLRQLVDDSTGASGLRPGQDKWKVSIGLGVLAVVFPLVPAVNYSSDPSLFPIIFLLCVGGAGFSIFSFLAKEPRRWWSVLGLVLSLIPAYFY